MTRCATNEPAATTEPIASAIRFVCTQVRHALQHVAAIGAFSPYLDAAWASRPFQLIWAMIRWYRARSVPGHDRMGDPGYGKTFASSRRQRPPDVSRTAVTKMPSRSATPGEPGGL